MTIQMKAAEINVSELQFILLYKVVLTFASVNTICFCYYSEQSCRGVLNFSSF